jgi:hypothetical protein
MPFKKIRCILKKLKIFNAEFSNNSLYWVWAGVDNVWE